MSEELGRGSCKTFLENMNSETKVSASSILKALDLCIKNNFFQFNGKIYQQTGGVGTGVKLAPTYACIGVGQFETLAFNSKQDLLKLILLWKRYIDDVFALFKGETYIRENKVETGSLCNASSLQFIQRSKAYNSK